MAHLRLLQKESALDTLTLQDLLSRQLHSRMPMVLEDTLTVSAMLQRMEEHGVVSAPVANATGACYTVIDYLDLLVLLLKDLGVVGDDAPPIRSAQVRSPTPQFKSLTVREVIDRLGSGRACSAVFAPLLSARGASLSRVLRLCFLRPSSSAPSGQALARELAPETSSPPSPGGPQRRPSRGGEEEQGHSPSRCCSAQEQMLSAPNSSQRGLVSPLTPSLSVQPPAPPQPGELLVPVVSATSDYFDPMLSAAQAAGPRRGSDVTQSAFAPGTGLSVPVSAAQRGALGSSYPRSTNRSSRPLVAAGRRGSAADGEGPTALSLPPPSRVTLRGEARGERAASHSPVGGRSRPPSMIASAICTPNCSFNAPGSGRRPNAELGVNLSFGVGRGGLGDKSHSLGTASVDSLRRTVHQDASIGRSGGGGKLHRPLRPAALPVNTPPNTPPVAHSPDPPGDGSSPSPPGTPLPAACQDSQSGSAWRERRPRRLVLTDQDSRPLRVLSTTDVLVFLHQQPTCLREFGKHVAELCGEKPHTVSVDTPLGRAFARMWELRAEALAIVDGNGVLLGNLSVSDLRQFRSFRDLALAALSDLSRFVAGQGGQAELVRVPVGATLRDVVDLCVRARVTRVYVTDDEGRPTSVVTHSDVLRLVTRTGGGGSQRPSPTVTPRASDRPLPPRDSPLRHGGVV
eukprot:TRINITY_DN9016_c0_g1_i1.p1 TRINITY_DN9016_c0_g1~~TRINITY_DN9016_c0_g1_i1.p1  ORF type:complete len:716 (+),score=126.79 TRINITY_DN9016_c0_g1_i1:96-2150(+)